MKSKPIIGITVDYLTKSDFSQFPHIALREDYFKAIITAGGIPVAIYNDQNNIAYYGDMLDGLLLPGGDFALDRNWYIANSSSPFEPSSRLSFDVNLTKLMLEKNKPVLGICAGMQILGGMYGCKITGDLTQYSNDNINHHIAKNEEAHLVTIYENTHLSKIFNCNTLSVNSSHKEAIVSLGNNVIASAIASDNIIEAIEVLNYKFAVGVQWHPEFLLNKHENKLFTALIENSLN